MTKGKSSVGWCPTLLWGSVVVAQESHKLQVGGSIPPPAFDKTSVLSYNTRSKSAVDGTVWGGEDVGSIPTFWTMR